MIAVEPVRISDVLTSSYKQKFDNISKRRAILTKIATVIYKKLRNRLTVLVSKYDIPKRR